ncbi:DUF2975 domain-containing protein [Glycomyces tenuis]|uniref:DUF2975 domain-containing protein n=1 Tax=Glycomyces tenuis TaxID=58116 RepID=UPI00041EBE13|nr:DUF2975 domain-containing protein [Glycomyces tenuis]
MHHFIVNMLRLAVGMAILLGLFGQIVVIPGMAAEEVERFPPYEPYAAPYVAIAVLGVACVQVALVAVWMLLGLVGRGTIFTPRAFRWVDTVIGAAAAATLLAMGVCVHLFVDDIPSPADGMELLGAFGGALACVGGGVAFIMFMAVMRNLLRKATDLKAEMAEVV